MNTTIQAPDLTQRPPRSPRTRLGGYALLPRMLDKGRATLAGKNGEYHYACPLDQRLLEFLGIEPEPLKSELATGKGDGEVLAWIQANQKKRNTPAEIAVWSASMDNREPEDGESKEFFDELLRAAAPSRTEVKTWSELLDLDDFVSFGGKA